LFSRAIFLTHHLIISIMAIVKYGALVTELRGSIGGTTFQRNKYGYSAKNKSLPGNVESTPRSNVKQAIRRISQHWATLSEANRNLWISFATTYPQPVKNNPSANMSGFAVFLKFNFFWYLRAGYIVNTPSFTLSSLPSFTVAIVKSSSFLNFVPTVSATDLLTVFIVSVSNPVKESVNFAKNRVRYMSFCYADNSGVSIDTAYVAQFGQLPNVGDWVFVKVTPTGLNAPYFWADQYFKVQITS
jgi:hypothetical protein